MTISLGIFDSAQSAAIKTATDMDDENSIPPYMFPGYFDISQ